MKLSLVVVCASLTAQEAISSTDPKHESLRQFRYVDASSDNAIQRSELSVSNSDNDIVKMDTVTVVERIARKDLEESIREHNELEQEKEFGWTKGGLIGVKRFGRVQAEFGAWPRFMSVPSGISNQQQTGVRIDLLHLKW